MSDLLPTPPLPTDDGGVPSPDVSSTADYTAESELNDRLNFAAGHAASIGAAAGKIADNSQIFDTILIWLFKVWAYFLEILLKAELTIDKEFVRLEADVMAAALPIWEQGQAEIDDALIGLLLAAIQGLPGDTLNFGNGPLAASGQSIFNHIVQSFTLMGGGVDPSRRGSGINNQQYLLQHALSLALVQQTIDAAGNHLGLGFLKDLRPFIEVIDRSINPSNVVRQAMEASYAFLLKAPLTRDLNRQFPVKDLGLTALAHLFIRGALPAETYYDKALDSGLDQAGADQLLIESSKQLSPGEIGDLLNHGFLTMADAQTFLGQLGYPITVAGAILYKYTHERYWAIAERVGNAAVAAWKKGQIDRARLEEILQQTGFRQDEITLLEIEAEFVKGTTEARTLTAAQIRALFEQNIIGIDDVIAFLEAEGYTPDDVRKLVLLDFTAAAERQARNAELIARLRVTAEANKKAAADEAAKNQTALANARKTLASELDAAAATLGQLEATPSIITLAGLIP